MSVGRICYRTTHLADSSESVQEAAKRMQAENVGTLLVIDSNRCPVGILTDRDLALRVVAAGLDPRATIVDQVMSSHPRSVGEETAIEDALATMRQLAVRRLPVVDRAGRLVGVVSIDDVLQVVTEELESLARIVGSSHPGVALPEARPSPRVERALASGLQRASSDLEC